jgi:V/A-type H+-transporting ATPase subunit K
MKKVLFATLLALVVLCAIAPFAMAAETTTVPAEGQAAAASSTNWKALGAALAVGLSALGSAYAQAHIGSAAAGTLAERPEVGGLLIVLEAIPETMIILGFVVALLILILA